MTKPRVVLAEVLAYHNDCGSADLDDKVPELIENALKANGFVICPKEPSEKMVEAGEEAFFADRMSAKHTSRMQAVYSAMLSTLEEE